MEEAASNSNTMIEGTILEWDQNTKRGVLQAGDEKANIRERDISHNEMLQRGDLLFGLVIYNRKQTQRDTAQDIRYTCTRAYSEEAWELQLIQNSKVKGLQGLTELTLQSNRAANELIELEERKKMASVRSRVRNRGGQWTVAMAATVHMTNEDEQTITEKMESDKAANPMIREEAQQTCGKQIDENGS